MDDEGTPTARTVLIERGILQGYMQDRLNARLLGMPLTGNGRRESFQHPPMPRMTNTFMLAGEDDPEEILKSVSHGLYAVAFSGGQGFAAHDNVQSILVFCPMARQSQLCMIDAHSSLPPPGSHRPPCRSASSP